MRKKKMNITEQEKQKIEETTETEEVTPQKEYEPLIPIMGLQRTLIETKIASWCVNSHLGVGILHLCQATTTLIAVISEEKAEKIIGTENWEHYTSIAGKLLYRTAIIKTYAEGLNNKTLLSRDVNNEQYMKYVEATSKISIYQPLLFKIFITLINKTTMRNTTLSNTYLEMLKQGLDFKSSKATEGTVNDDTYVDEDEVTEIEDGGD